MASQEGQNNPTRFDVVIVGAGFGGLVTLHRVRQQGLSVRLFEAGAGVGGTWYWNRYPGARVDIESIEYSFSFDQGLQNEWHWTERYAAQPELVRYMNHVADRFNMRPDIALSTKVTAAHFDESTNRWEVRTDRGDRVSAKYVIMATGFLSAGNKPKFSGLDSFKGKQFETSKWPETGVDFSGQRVAVIGTGSSGVQCIPLIAQEAKHLTVFQRTPAFSIPLRNGPINLDFERRVKSDYPAWRRRQLAAPLGFAAMHFDAAPPTSASAMDDTPEERLADYENRWKSGGLCYYNGYPDLLVNKASNDTLSEFIRGKIRERLGDPALAEVLVPDYPIMTKRLCADTNYYETYKRDNVTLVSIKNTPIEAITPNGVQVAGKEYAVDSIVFATGFDAVTGAMNNIDIRGRAGRTMKEHWANGPRAYLGLMSVGFPNLFYVDGPCSPGALFNPITICEYQSDWILRCMMHLGTGKQACIEAQLEHEDAWMQHLNEVGDSTLLPHSKNWYYGDNIPGKPRVILAYLGGFKLYAEQCGLGEANGYKRFVSSTA
ncbi:MAG: flavin-containing monooxygenase [Panacagrimonas sp.]